MVWYKIIIVLALKNLNKKKYCEQFIHNIREENIKWTLLLIISKKKSNMKGKEMP